MSGFKIGIGAPLLFFAAFFFGTAELVLIIVLAAAAHELGHYGAIRLCGGRVTGIKLGLTGIVMRCSGIRSYTSEIVTAAAGPAASFVLAVVCAFYARLFNYPPAYSLSGMSLIFCLFNLLPVLPLDGGRVLYNFAARVFGLEAADKLTCAVGCVALFAALCVGAYVFAVTKKNFTLLAAAVVLLVYYCKNSGNSIKWAD